MTPYRDQTSKIIDSKTFIILLKGACNGTHGDTWIKGIQCGKGVIQALQQQYDGDVESYKHTQAAKHNN